MERTIEVRYGRTREWDEGIVKTYYWTERRDMQGEHVLDVEKFRTSPLKDGVLYLEFTSISENAFKILSLAKRDIPRRHKGPDIFILLLFFLT